MTDRPGLRHAARVCPRGRRGTARQAAARLDARRASLGGGMRRSAGNLDQAIRLDPNSAIAYNGPLMLNTTRPALRMLALGYDALTSK
jgi:hypothetical protein